MPTHYTYTDSGEGDIRARRTRKQLKQAFLDALGDAKSDDARITVKDLTETIEINRKTFYLHYSGIKELTEEIAEDISRFLSSEFNNDLKHDIYVLYDFFYTADTATQRLLTSQKYRPCQRHFINAVFTEGAFGDITEKSDFPDLVTGYFDSIMGIYRGAVYKFGKDIDIRSLSDKAYKMVFFGLGGGY